jgi:hypothetical protein
MSRIASKGIPARVVRRSDAAASPAKFVRQPSEPVQLAVARGGASKRPAPFVSGSKSTGSAIGMVGLRCSSPAEKDEVFLLTVGLVEYTAVHLYS